MLRTLLLFVTLATVAATWEGDDSTCVLSAQRKGSAFYKKNKTSCYQSHRPLEDFLPTPAYGAQAFQWSFEVGDDDDAAAIAGFHNSSVAGLNPTVPSDFNSLYVNTAPATTGVCVDDVTGPEQVPDILTYAKVTPDNPHYANLTRDLPLLFEATGGGTVKVLSFVVLNPTSGELQVTMAGVQRTSNTTFRVQVLDGRVVGNIVQQQKDDHECYHCFLWVICCHDTMVNVPDTTAQMDDIREGTEAALAGFWKSASYPIGSCLVIPEKEAKQNDPTPKGLVEENNDLRMAYVDAKPEDIFDFVIPRLFEPNSSADFEVLYEQQKALLTSPSIQHLLHRNTSNPFVQHFQEELATMSEYTDSVSLSGVLVADVPLMLNMSMNDANTTTEITEMIYDNMLSVPIENDVWMQNTIMHTGKDGYVDISTVFLYPLEKNASNYTTKVDTVIITSTFDYKTDLVDVRIQLHKDKHGRLVPVVNVTHLPDNATGADKQQVVALAEYLTAEAVLRLLEPSSPVTRASPTSPLKVSSTLSTKPPTIYMEVYEFTRKAMAEGNMIEVPVEFFLTSDIDILDALLEDAALRDSLLNFADLLKSAISTIKAIGGFIHSTSVNEKMVCEPGFNNLVTYKDMIKLAGVIIDPQDNATGTEMCTLQLKPFNSTIVEECIEKIQLMSLATGDAPSAWDLMQHAANLTEDGRISGSIFHFTMTPNVNGSDPLKPQPHDFAWIVYSYSFDFHGAVELVTTTSSWFGGLISNEHVQVIHLPPEWTNTSATEMDTFLQATLTDGLCVLLNTDPSNPCPPPPSFPSPSSPILLPRPPVARSETSFLGDPTKAKQMIDTLLSHR